MDHFKALAVSLKCWAKLVQAIEELPDSDRKQQEIDAIFEMRWMNKPIDY